MSRRYYIMPVVESVWQEMPYREGKHRVAVCTAGYRFGIMDYGPEYWCIARIIPAPQDEDHALLISDPQVFPIPENINNAIGANATTVTNKLEAANIPGDWITPATTWRTLLLRLAAYCHLMSKAAGLEDNYIDRMFDGGRTLDSTYGDLPTGARRRLRNAADFFGFDRSGINSNTTLRDALKQIAHQWTKYEKFVESER